MKYMVMECHLSYAVVMDEEGRFLKVANRHYEIGQTVTNVIEMIVPEPVPQKKKIPKWFYSMTTVAACFLIMITVLFQMNQNTYASVRLQINPDVRINLNKSNKVIGLTAENEDGKILIDKYNYKKKDLTTVTDELINKAIDLGFLQNGGKISITFDSKHDDWILSNEKELSIHIKEHLKNRISVTIQVGNIVSTPDPIVIPITPETANESLQPSQSIPSDDDTLENDFDDYEDDDYENNFDHPDDDDYENNLNTIMNVDKPIEEIDDDDLSNTDDMDDSDEE